VRRRRRDGERGQSLVEFAFIVPVFMIFLLGMLEFGFAFDHLLTLNYASREGARVGAALADGSKLPDCNDVDKYVVAAVERVLKSDGSPIKGDLTRVSSIKIFQATSAGVQSGGFVNTWVPGSSTLPDGTALSFALQGGTGWTQCTRDNTTAHPDSMGVSVSYTYRAITPLAGILDFIGGGGWSNLPMSDKTVMALNPTD
jgi:hypothetical protein